MDYQILTEIDIIIDEMKDWETEQEQRWTPEQRMQYLNTKLENFQNFLMNQADFWEKEFAKGSGSAQPDNSAQREAEERAAAQEKAALERAAAEKAARERIEAEKLAAQEKAALERAAAEKAARERIEAEKLASERASQERAAAQEKAAQEKALAEKIAAEKRAAVQQQSAVKPTLSDSGATELNDHLEAERKDAIFRIGRPVNKQAADLTDPAVLEAYLRVRNDTDPLMWFILGYPPNSQNRLIVTASGTGGFSEMQNNIVEDAQFVYINYKFGDTQRSKFIFMTYVPDSLGGIKKSRVVGHRPPVEKMLKYIHLQWHILDKNEMKEEILEQKLLAAGGANYSVQESNKGDFSGYKQTTKDFYTEKDKNTQLTDVLYEKGPLSRETPMDIGGRPMVATQSEFKSNIRDLK